MAGLDCSGDGGRGERGACSWPGRELGRMVDLPSSSVGGLALWSYWQAADFGTRPMRVCQLKVSGGCEVFVGVPEGAVVYGVYGHGAVVAPAVEGSLL